MTTPPLLQMIIAAIRKTNEDFTDCDPRITTWTRRFARYLEDATK